MALQCCLSRGTHQLSMVKVYPRHTWNFRACAVSACISLWHHGAMHAVCAYISMWCHGPITWLLHALIGWDLKFQVCLGYTFTPATLLFLCSRQNEQYCWHKKQGHIIITAWRSHIRLVPGLSPEQLFVDLESNVVVDVDKRSFVVS